MSQPEMYHQIMNPMCTRFVAIDRAKGSTSVSIVKRMVSTEEMIVTKDC